jgi:hypothetical protein
MDENSRRIQVTAVSLDLMRRVWLPIAAGADVTSWHDLAAGLEADGVDHGDSISAAVRLVALRNTAMVDEVVAIALANPRSMDAILTAAAGIPSAPLSVGPGLPVHFVPIQLLEAADDLIEQVAEKAIS